MRKIAFIKTQESVQKLMLYEYSSGVYLFGYDCLNDTSSIWDMHYDSVTESLEYCHEMFSIEDEDWIEISGPKPDCQHDFVLPTKKQNADSEKYQSFVNGKWIDNFITKLHNLNGLTGNERLFLTGLIDEFYEAKSKDEIKAQKILNALDIK